MHIDVEAAVPVFVSEFPDGGKRLHSTGIVHQDVEAAKDLLGSVE